MHDASAENASGSQPQGEQPCPYCGDKASALPLQGEPVAWIPADALDQLAPPRLILRGVTLLTYAGEGHVPLFTHPTPLQGEQADAIRAQERERIAHHMEQSASVISGPNEGDGHYELLCNFAAAIRNGKAGG